MVWYATGKIRQVLMWIVWIYFSHFLSWTWFFTSALYFLVYLFLGYSFSPLLNPRGIHLQNPFFSNAITLALESTFDRTSDHVSGWYLWSRISLFRSDRLVNTSFFFFF